MRSGKINPLSDYLDSLHSNAEDLYFCNTKKRKADDRISNIAISKMPHPKLNSIIHDKLLATVIPPQFFLRFFHDLFISKKNGFSSPKKEKANFLNKKANYNRNINCLAPKLPIGLRPSSSTGWINALMQFMIFVPSLRQLFDVVPRSLYPFSDFVDQYISDQNKNALVSEANSEILIHNLIDKFSYYFREKGNKIVLYDILNLFLTAIQGNSFSLKISKWHIVCNGKFCSCLSLDQHIGDNIKSWQTSAECSSDNNDFYFPPEFKIAFPKTNFEDPGFNNESLQHPAFLAKKQYFFFHKGLFTICYELEAFVELRFDSRNDYFYICYIKMDGSWFLCDDMRIKKIRSNLLDLPISRGILFYYKKVSLGIPNQEIV